VQIRPAAAELVRVRLAADLGSCGMLIPCVEDAGPANVEAIARHPLVTGYTCLCVGDLKSTLENARRSLVAHTRGMPDPAGKADTARPRAVGMPASRRPHASLKGVDDAARLHGALPVG
jgi:hypothetical protein